MRLTEEQRGSAAPSTSHQRDHDLIVWPETVLRVYLHDDGTYLARVLDLVRRADTPLLVGALDLPADGAGERNSAYLIEPSLVAPASGRQAGGTPALRAYHKQTLLPFGEYVPGAAWLPWLNGWRTTGRFVSGNDSTPLTLALARNETEKRPHGRAPLDADTHLTEHEPRARRTTIAPSICFEAVLPGFSNGMVRHGAEFLVNLTDDGWFGDTAGPYQHLQGAALRAVETRRWLVRASNSGISAFVDPTGHIVESMPLGAVGVLRRRIGTSQTPTLYVRLGNWIVALCAVVLALSVTRACRRSG